MAKIRKKVMLQKSVYEAAKDRIRYLHDSYSNVAVSFSGGKDSTALLLLAIEVARDIGKLPVEVFFYDEEAIHPTTIEYVERVRQMPEVDFKWYCLPVKHRNACSNDQPFWHCWHPDEKHLWVREMPEFAITDHPRFIFGQSMQEFGLNHYKNTNTVVMQGVRAEESMRRYQAVARKKNDNYISKPEKGVYFAYPIYDWSSKDVWKLVQVKNSDYNKTYDIFNKTEKFEHFLRQRVCPPFGEEPLRGLSLYAECWPDLWHKMIYRVPGASTAARYANTELYSQGLKPDQTSWRQHVQNVLDTYSGKEKTQVSQVLNAQIRRHRSLTDDPIPENQAHPYTGLSWRFLSKLVTRGDFKGRISQKIVQEANSAQHAYGITQQEAEMRYGKNKV
jgi:predicted phosphoadenosine phosphosulfate sulfurtransferase